MCQIFCLDGDRSGNFVRIENAVSEAAKAGADIICFPETALLGWVNPAAHERAFEIPGQDTNRFAQLAKKYKKHLCVGLAEKDGDKLYDSVVLIDDRGRILLKHRKINILTELRPGSQIIIELVSVECFTSLEVLSNLRTTQFMVRDDHVVQTTIPVETSSRPSSHCITNLQHTIRGVVDTDPIVRSVLANPETKAVDLLTVDAFLMHRKLTYIMYGNPAALLAYLDDENISHGVAPEAVALIRNFQNMNLKQL